MKVVFVRDLSDKAKAGDIKEVADGYARNYLIPKGIAMPATPGALKSVEVKNKIEGARATRVRNEADALAEELKRLSLVIKAKAGEGGRLYGSVTTADIAAELERATGKAMDKRRILLDEPIKKLGNYEVPVKLAPQVTPKVLVVVEKEGA